MGLFDTLQTINNDNIDSIPANMIGKIKSYYNGAVTVSTEDGTLQNIPTLKTPTIGSQCILIPTGETYLCIPLEIDTITGLSWTSIPVTKGTLTVNKAIRLAHFTYSESVTFSTANTAITIQSENIPEDYRPTVRKTTVAHEYTGSLRIIYIEPEGDLKANSSSTGSASLKANLMWKY